jgi:CO dehydrogenase/acetyl-CoA synthase alpha subunit
MGVRFAPNVPHAWKTSQAHPMVLLADIVKWKLVSDRFEIVLIPMQDRCTVCTECTTFIVIFSFTPDGTFR